MKKIYYLLVFLFILSSCQSIKDAGKIMRNEKVKTTDEFLVKKRKPLVLPPDYNDLPTPDSVKRENLNVWTFRIKDHLICYLQLTCC